MRRLGTKSFLGWCFLVASALCIVLPVLFECYFHNHNEVITIIAVLVTAIAAILTFVIALLLYEKFGVERSVKERAVTRMLELLEFLNTHYINVFFNGGAFPIKMIDPLNDI